MMWANFRKYFMFHKENTTGKQCFISSQDTKPLKLPKKTQTT